jgi:predicted exporter
MTNNPIIKLLVLAIVAYAVSFVPFDARIKQLCYFVIGLAVLFVLVSWLFPGVLWSN